MQKNFPKVPLMAYMNPRGQLSEASFRLRFVTILTHMMLKNQQMRKASTRLSIESISQSKTPHASKIWKRHTSSSFEAKWAVGTSRALECPLQALMQGLRGAESFSRYRMRPRYKVANEPIRSYDCCAWVVVGVVLSS
jgi:hypothetical protein